MTTRTATKADLHWAYRQLRVFTPGRAEHVAIEDASDHTLCLALAHCQLMADTARTEAKRDLWNDRYDAICKDAWGTYSRRPFGLEEGVALTVEEATA